MRYLVALALSLSSAAPAQEGSNALRFNQTGFEATGAKRAVLVSDATAPMDWTLVDAQGATVATGKTQPYGRDPSSGERVQLIDFSRFDKAGDGYRLRVGDSQSRPLAIGADPYRKLQYDALAFFYHQRAGVPIEARYAGENWARPAGHSHEIVSCFAGSDEDGLKWPGCGYSLDVTGGWYDAGDQGKYVVNGGIALWTLMNLYERQKIEGVTSPFTEGKVDIPTAGNGVDDLLDHARYEMEFLLAMQVPDGERVTVAVGRTRRGKKPRLVSIDAGGMAHHKVADLNWTPLPTPPHLDRETRALYPPSTGATLNLAATAAQCARLWRGIDDVFAGRCLAAAEHAWAGAKRNPEVYFVGLLTGSGGYGDRDVSDEFYWAAAELYAATGKADYAEAVRTSLWFTHDVSEASWAGTAALGTITLALVPNGLAKEDVTRLRASIATAADRFLADEPRTGYAIPYAPAQWPWGSTSSLLNRAMLLAYAADWMGKQRYRDGVIDAMDFILGRNAVDRSFVSGYGARPIANPHHRFWAHSLDPKLPGPPPGVLSGGPNSGSFSDPVAAKMRGHCIGQACWADDIQAFTMNEVAINWNAPLVWVSAWLAEKE